MPHCKPALLGSLALSLALALSACGSSSASNGITVYSGQHEQTTALLVAAFERQSGIKVSLRSGDEAALGNQVIQEGASSPADVFYSANSPVLESLREHGLLTTVAPGTMPAIPARYSSPIGAWVGISARVSALGYDATKLSASALPSSILELAQPRWQGMLGFAPSETDFQPLVAAILKRDGAGAAEAWLKGLQRNGHEYSNNETVLIQINDGQIAIGPIEHYYWYRLRAELGAGAMHAALHYFAPGDVGELLVVSGAAVLRSSAHKAAAQRFLAFLTSAAAQRVIATSHSYEYPLRPGVSAGAGLVPLSRLRPASLTPADLGDGRAALELEQKLGLL